MNNKEFKSHFGMGDAVYLLTDVDQDKYMVTGINFDIAGGHMYVISLGSIPSVVAYQQELSLTKNFKHD